SPAHVSRHPLAQIGSTMHDWRLACANVDIPRTATSAATNLSNLRIVAPSIGMVVGRPSPWEGWIYERNWGTVNKSRRPNRSGGSLSRMGGDQNGKECHVREV